MSASFNPIIAAERQHAVNGVPGRYVGATVRHDEKPGCFCQQRWISETRPIKGYGPGAYIRAELRFDDDCSNGHNSFAITAEVRVPGRRDIQAGGCLHDDIAAVFPELAPLIKWHLMATDGPMHYLANTLFLAGNADYNGRHAGDVSAWSYGFRFGNSPVTHIVNKSLYQFIEDRRAVDAGSFAIVPIAHQDRPGESYKFGPKYTFVGYGEKWHECPFDSEVEAQEFALALNTCTVTPVRIATAYAEGKARELDAARRAAAWPDATDEQLSSDKETLRGLLLARLPGLIAEFRADMESAGFLWSPESVKGE